MAQELMKESVDATLYTIVQDVAERIKRTEYVTSEFEVLVKCYLELYKAYRGD